MSHGEITMLVTPLQKIKKNWKREKSASDHINIIGHLDEKTLIDKDGQLIRLFSLKGIDPMTKSDAQLEALKQARNSLWKHFSSEFAVYTWMIRTYDWETLQSELPVGFSKMCHDQYKEALHKKSLLQNHLVLALVTKSPEGALQKTLTFLERFNPKNDSAARQLQRKKTLDSLEQMTQHLLRAMVDYGIELIQSHPLSTESKHSPALRFLTHLLNTKPFAMPYGAGDMRTCLTQTRLFFNSRTGLIQWRFLDGTTKVGAVVSIKEYANFTMLGLLDALSMVPHECIVTQSYGFLDRGDSKKQLKNQRMDLEQTHDDSQSQTDALSAALDETASGEVAFGHHHVSILCLATNGDELKEAVASVCSALSDQDILAVREDLLTECAFWAQLPGNFSYSPRPSLISTQNFSGFASFHNTALGQKENNFWGDAVTVLETQTGSPYYFNFHHRDVGNTLIFGSMGSGKTALMGFLLSESLKFGGKRIVFDKDRGLEIAVRALGGVYEQLKPGHPTGFNPCQLSDTLENRAFLSTLFRKILTCHGQAWGEGEAEQVEKVVETLYTLEFNDRRFRDIAPIFGSKARGSLRARFDEWHSDGVFAWVFDNAHDTLNLDADIIGLELGALIKEDIAKIPACLYLMHRVNAAFEGQRGALFIDEGWALLDDPFFKVELESWGRTPRKKNRFLVLATQSADDAVKSSVCDALITSSSNLICFPNPSARFETYVTRLGLPHHLFDSIKKMNVSDRYFLLHHGKGKESVIVRADLSSCPDILSVLSGRESSVLALDKLRQTVGDNPAQWLETFLHSVQQGRL